MKLLNTEELALKLRVHTNSIYSWRKKGMPYIKAGRNMRYDYDDVVNWLKNKEVK